MHRLTLTDNDHVMFVPKLPDDKALFKLIKSALPYDGQD